MDQALMAARWPQRRTRQLTGTGLANFFPTEYEVSL
jgi:hypothetical protein